MPETKRLDRATVERRITEMWSAMEDAPRDEHYDLAYQQCTAAAARMRTQLDEQDRLDAAAPDLLAAVEAATKALATIIQDAKLIPDPRATMASPTWAVPSKDIAHAVDALDLLRPAAAKAKGEA